MNFDDPNDTTIDDDTGAFADGYEVDPNADRGDAVVDDDAAQAEADAKAAIEATKGKDADKEDKDGKDADKDAARDEKGRFKKKEGEEDEDDEDDDDEEDDDKDDKANKNYDIRIAKMKEQRDAERAEKARLQAELEAMRQQTAKAKPEPTKSEVEVLDEQAEALYVKVEEARADGNIAEAAALQRQLDTLNRKIATIEATQVATTVTVEQRANAQYDHMLSQLESVAPVLVPGTEDYDPKVVAELEFLVESFESKGLSAPAALRKASTYLFGTDPWGAAPAKAVEDAAPPAKDKKPEAKKPDIKKAVEHSKKDPGDISKDGANVDSSKINPLELDDEEFDALPEEVKRRYRGDTYA